MALQDKEIILEVGELPPPASVLEEAKVIGIKRVIIRGKPAGGTGLSVVQLSDSVQTEDTAAWIEVSKAEDLPRALEASSRKHEFVVVQCTDWKIIPLENLIAEFRRRGKKLYAFMNERKDIELAFAILEKGVDGVVIPPEFLDVAKKLQLSMMGIGPFSLVGARVSRIVDIGVGDRACVDTASQLVLGEGMLVGSKANFFFLIHSETVPTKYMPTRPFRVNAGAIHSYLLSGGRKTRYLSELESGDRIVVIDFRETAREVAVGRIKIERRPLVMVEAVVGGERGTVMLQKAETIRLVKRDGTPVAVTELKEGDEVLVNLTETEGRHLGGEVEEFVLEK
jgi:3-dehydroquinate synthase II